MTIDTDGPYTTVVLDTDEATRLAYGLLHQIVNYPNTGDYELDDRGKRLAVLVRPAEEKKKPKRRT